MLRIVVTALVLATLIATPVHACPVYAPDFPGLCTCAPEPTNWPANVVVGNAIATAEAFVGVQESCAPNRGQPFWQIQRYLDTPQLGLLSAEILFAFGIDVGPEAQPWSTEFVVLVHDLAEIPDDRGLESELSISARHGDPRLLLAYYGIQDIVTRGAHPFFPLFPRGGFDPAGRGIVVDGTQLDFADFRPGFNAPCPGAVQFTDTLGGGAGAGWVGRGAAQLITDMVLHRNAVGDVVRFDVKVIQGDTPTDAFFEAPHQNERRASVQSFWIEDAQSFTRPGRTNLYGQSNRRIRGWGINFREGQPLCDVERITIVGGPPDGIVAYLPEGRDEQTQGFLDLMGSFFDGLEEETQITTSDPAPMNTDRVPDEDTPWMIPAGFYEGGLSIAIELDTAFPLPVDGIDVIFADGVLPPTFRVLITDGGAGEGTAEWPTLNSSQEFEQPAPVSLRRAFDDGEVALRTLTFFLPEFLPQGVTISRIEPILASSFVEISEGPQETVTSIATRSRSLAWRRDGSSIFLGSIEEFVDAPAGSTIEIGVFDARGRRVHDARIEAPDGSARFVWLGEDDRGSRVGRGVYHLRASSGGAHAVKKLIVLE